MSHLLSRFLPVGTLLPRQSHCGSSSLLRSLPSNLIKTVILSSCLASVPAILMPGANAQNKPIAALTPGLLTIVAGTGANGYTGDTGPATAATFNANFGLAVDASGNVFIADSNNQVIRKVTTSTGIVTTFAGNGIQGHTGDGGPALQAEFNGPDGLAFDAAGNLYVSELSAVVRKITPAGIITTVAGVYSGPGGFYGDNGPATSAGLNRPYSVYADAAGDLYIADTGNNVIRRVDAQTGIITTVAGNGYGSNGQANDYCGTTGFTNLGGYTGDGGLATSAELFGPRSVAIDAAGDLYIADTCNNVIREINASTGIITTIAGDGFGAGGAPGSGSYSGDGIKATSGKLNLPEHILLDPAGDLYIADTENFRIRFVNLAQIMTTIAGNGTSTAPVNNVAANATGMHLQSLAFDSAYNLYIADAHDNQVLKIDVTQGVVNFPTPTLPGTLDYADGLKNLTLTNVGDGPLTTESESSAPGYVNYLDEVRGVCEPLQPGKPCANIFGFSPLRSQSGPVDGTITIGDNSQLGKQTVHLTGIAVSSPDFILNFQYAVIVRRGGSGRVALYALPVNGFAGTISLSASNLPKGASIEFASPTITFPGTGGTSARINIPGNLAIGIYPITLTATSGAITNSTNIYIIVY